MDEGEVPLAMAAGILPFSLSLEVCKEMGSSAKDKGSPFLYTPIKMTNLII